MTISTQVDATGTTATILMDTRFTFTEHAAFTSAYRNLGKKYHRYVVDLRDVERMDSSALQMLIQLRDYVGDKRDRITIVSGYSQAAEILQISRFDEVFQIRGEY